MPNKMMMREKDMMMKGMERTPMMKGGRMLGELPEQRKLRAALGSEVASPGGTMVASPAKKTKGAMGKVGKVMHEFKAGTLKSGKGGKGGKVTSRKQAVAIGLSEARKKGAKIPYKKGRRNKY